MSSIKEEMEEICVAVRFAVATAATAALYVARLRAVLDPFLVEGATGWEAAGLLLEAAGLYAPVAAAAAGGCREALIVNQGLSRAVQALDIWGAG